MMGLGDWRTKLCGSGILQRAFGWELARRWGIWTPVHRPVPGSHGLAPEASHGLIRRGLCPLARDVRLSFQL